MYHIIGMRDFNWYTEISQDQSQNRINTYSDNMLFIYDDNSAINMLCKSKGNYTFCGFLSGSIFICCFKGAIVLINWGIATIVDISYRVSLNIFLYTE